MARVLFANELYASLGRLKHLLPIAERVRAKGHHVAFALSDVTRADDVLGRHGFEYLQAPIWHRRLPRPLVVPCSYSEILQHYGYADCEGLLGMVKAWREIYRLVDPHVVIFDDAPTALLACRGFEAMRLLYGVGFSSPPRTTPFPNFRTWEPVPVERLEASDGQVLDTMNWVLKKLHLRPLAAAHELFDVDEEFICTFRELDHYAGRQGGAYCGSMFVRDEGAEPAWPDGDGKRIYVYLPPERRAFAAIAEALRETRECVLWFAPGITAQTIQRYQAPSLRFMQAPVRLAALGSVDAAVLCGGHGTTSALLLAGVPLALFPTRVEQALVARRVAAFGAGVMAAPNATFDEMQSSMRAVLNDGAFKTNALDFSRRYAQHDPQKIAARIARRVEHYCEVRTA